ncbi:hypothetical protein [Aurantimonas sp. HBX-1]|uniref:hypothetical protein n=1 Tax=Aurantimonas sp. HBX-1 TaxID=2906072 RepID=UPI001F270325|nr:hypothetical protein [Aurantimonas sp. HBX-1]UIJ73379.1 hypothetical protein LXB15_07015 [Aurantimonas sp. HBX-1]
MTSEQELWAAVNSMLDSLDPVVQAYGGLDPYAIIDLLSEELDVPHETIEAMLRDEASRRNPLASRATAYRALTQHDALHHLASDFAAALACRRYRERSLAGSSPRVFVFSSIGFSMA